MGLANVPHERGIPSRRNSPDCADLVPALCTHRPSLLPIEWSSEGTGLAPLEPLPPRRAAPSGRRKGVQAGSFRGSKSRNKVSVGEPAEGSLTSSATQEAASVQQQQQQQRHHHCHRRRRSRGRRRRRCRKRHLSVPVQLERRVNGRERASEPADQARFGGWGFLGRATPCSHWAARRCSSSSSSSISRSRWLAGWLACVPSTGGSRHGSPASSLPPSPGIWEEAEPKSLCQPRLGHRGLRGERRRRAQQLCEPVRVFGAVGRAFSQGAGRPLPGRGAGGAPVCGRVG